MKRRFKTYADCEAAYTEADRQNNCMRIALAEVLEKKVQWFRATSDGFKTRVGLLRATGPHGGIVLIYANKMPAALYLDDWARQVRSDAQIGQRYALDLLPVLGEILCARDHAITLDEARRRAAAVMSHAIIFKTKVRKLTEPNGSESDYVELKRAVSRSDTDMKPCDHTYYNSDLFPAILNRAYQKAIGGREWVRLRDLPPGVSVDTSKFLAVVRIELDFNTGS